MTFAIALCRSGRSGRTLDGFPIKLGGRVGAQPVVFPVGGQSVIGLSAFDGYVYLIEAKKGCVEKLDVGDFSHGPLLLSRSPWDDSTLAVLASASGRVHCLRFGVSYERYSAQRAVRLLDASSASRWGRSLVVRLSTQAMLFGGRGTVTGSLSMGGVLLWQGPIVASGAHRISVEMPSTRGRRTLVLSVRDSYGVTHTAYQSVALNLGTHRLLKFSIVVPLVVSALVILLAVTQSNSPHL